MTTEAGSKTEVKEKAEESAAGPDQSEQAKQEHQEGENAVREEKEGKGISRYLPTWFKKPKSQSQTSPTKEVQPTEEPASKATKEEEGPSPDVNGHAEEVEEKEEVKSEQVKETEAETHSNTSADTEPAKGERVEEVEEQSPEEAKETKEGEGAEEEKKEGQVEAEGNGQTSVFQSPLRVVRKTKMKVIVCHVTLLDGTDFTCEVEKRAKGQFLFFKVCEHLNLLEKDYFGLIYKDNHEQKCWLDPTKEIKRQIRSNNWQFTFNVKFYPPDPSLLTEDITRYLLCLQLREDVASGRLPCSFVTHALLGSYTLQAEFGDYEPDQPRPLDFINQLTFAPNQNKEMEEKILELHKSHRGMTPAQADLQFLENAKKLSMYGVDLHHAKDSEGVDIMLGVCANGLLVYKDRLRINRFAWPKILKISYKRNNFYIKIRPGETEQFESTVGFKLQNHRSAKRLWKVCVENHSFFRLNAPEPPNKARFLTLGSKFRYSGRTQAQTRLASSLIDRPAPSFDRTSSKRISRSLDGAPVISVTAAGRDGAENGRDPHLELHSDSKVSVSQTEAASAENTISETKEPEKMTEIEIEETVVIQEVSKATKAGLVTVPPSPPPPPAAAAPPAEQETQQQEVKVQEEVVTVEETQQRKQESVSSESESEEEAEYHPDVPVSLCQTQIPEEKEEEEEEEEEEDVEPEKEVEEQVSPPVALPALAEVSHPEDETSQEGVCRKEDADENKEQEHETEESTDDVMVTPDEAPDSPLLSEETEKTAPSEEKEPRVNGEALLVEVDPRPQVICCSEPPVVKTEMVTISDTFAAQKTEIATKEVPIVHTETKTITYEAAQLDGNGDGEPGVLMTAQTITSESLCTTTTTHITKTLKGGLSETRIEKRIVITGDCDIDHDQALAQAIKEAKEQHPDMSVTRVVVHKETELAEEED
ncbi:band 4.1-like protein 2 isoform X6 [Nothobranchius furzeri]|uniref:band 4.1-like protein 2 isoform X6 n=1 Tax=Nothobranchius furzeri TaxID=105023 RepID=UPI0024042154|nr:band 4.1-like protein 2 isoform X6 [Nothobranchius furzeri]